MKFELVLTTMVAPRAAISSISSGRSQMQWANDTRSLTRPISSRYRTMPWR